MDMSLCIPCLAEVQKASPLGQSAKSMLGPEATFFLRNRLDAVRAASTVLSDAAKFKTHSQKLRLIMDGKKGKAARARDFLCAVCF